jgi:hypothetical protein
MHLRKSAKDNMYAYNVTVIVVLTVPNGSVMLTESYGKVVLTESKGTIHVYKVMRHAQGAPVMLFPGI